MRRPSSILLVLTLLLAAAPARAQETSTDWAWKPLLVHEGLDFSFIYYARPGGVADGVVIKLANRNDHAVRYRFEVVFRSARDSVVVAEAAGTMAAREVRTGDEEGLYWVPFTDGQSIAELGLRGYRVTRVEEP